MPRSSRGSECARCRARRGFTLLEVLGAVLVLGMLYSVLAEVAIQGLRAEGESRRRLEASLFADELMSDIEASMDNGEALPLGLSEEEEDPYIIELEVSPIDTGTLFPPGVLGEEVTLAELMGAQTDESPIREIVLTISWSEGDRELRVRRTTLGLSPMEFEAMPSGGGPASGDSDAGEGAIGAGGATGGGDASAAGGAGEDSSRTNVQKRREQWVESGRLDDLLRRREERRRRNQNQ